MLGGPGALGEDAPLVGRLPAALFQARLDEATRPEHLRALVADAGENAAVRAALLERTPVAPWDVPLLRWLSGRDADAVHLIARRLTDPPLRAWCVAWAAHATLRTRRHRAPLANAGARLLVTAAAETWLDETAPIWDEVRRLHDGRRQSACPLAPVRAAAVLLALRFTSAPELAVLARDPRVGPLHLALVLTHPNGDVAAGRAVVARAAAWSPDAAPPGDQPSRRPRRTVTRRMLVTSRWTGRYIAPPESAPSAPAWSTIWRLAANQPALVLDPEAGPVLEAVARRGHPGALCGFVATPEAPYSADALAAVLALAERGSDRPRLILALEAIWARAQAGTLARHPLEAWPTALWARLLAMDDALVRATTTLLLGTGPARPPRP